MNPKLLQTIIDLAKRKNATAISFFILGVAACVQFPAFYAWAQTHLDGVVLMLTGAGVFGVGVVQTVGRDKAQKAVAVATADKALNMTPPVSDADRAAKLAALEVKP